MMATVKRITDLSKYTSVLPYASELFGVYQPLLGWKSKRLEQRFNDAFKNDRSVMINKLKDQFSDLVHLNIVRSGLSGNSDLQIAIKPGALIRGKIRPSDSLVLEKISSQLPVFEKYKDSIWIEVITADKIESILTNDVVLFYSKIFQEQQNDRRTPHTEKATISVLKKQLQYESSIAGALLFLVEEKSHHVLEELFYRSMNRTEQAKKLIKMINSENSGEAFLDIENLDPTEQDQLKGVTLSPISVVHLFRQYFFELDTFLGTPEGHVWLSPGASVELIEEHTRKSIVEKTFESSLDIFTKSESETVTQDEISDAVNEENSKSINLGASVTASYTKIEATANFDYESSQNKAREKTHKSMREQTEKLSSEIRKNFKTSFKTVTEYTDFSRTKHLLSNTTDKLINYELRRKMRQVGVQVQDIGTYLCWQTYVDDPGKDLGLAKLVHIAQSAELDGLQHPEEIPRLQGFTESRTITIPFVSTNTEGADKGEVYVDGEESDGNTEGSGVFNTGEGNFETIKADFPQKFVSPKADHELKQVEFDSSGRPITVSIGKDDQNKTTLKSTNGHAEFTLHLDIVNFEGNSSITIDLILHWSPNGDANVEIDKKNKENTENFKAEEKLAYESAYLDTVKDRINAVSNITTRNRAELREEERIIIYRKLIQDLLQNKVSQPDDRTRHVVAELINSIFDVNKMLYFVAPEWWRPRLHQSKQQLYETSAKPTRRNNARSSSFGSAATFGEVFVDEMGSATAVEEDPSDVDPSILTSNTAGWGDIDDTRRDNYFITEDSTPAKYGSSLGWLMQLDGDNMRNAFLNAPWVKAVMPIRPGKEKAAINWLSAVEGLNGFSDIDALKDLATKIEKKHKNGIKPGIYPNEGDDVDPALVDEDNTVTSTPIDRVYEHGYFPLENSFRANVGEDYEIFDQWVEILPTDQSVPVEVEYDPKTGRQI